MLHYALHDPYLMGLYFRCTPVTRALGRKSILWADVVDITQDRVENNTSLLNCQSADDVKQDLWLFLDKMKTQVMLL